MKTKCDECIKEFEFKTSCIKTRWFGDLEVKFFRCPICGEPYITCVTDNTLRLLISKQNNNRLSQEVLDYAKVHDLHSKVDINKLRK